MILLFPFKPEPTQCSFTSHGSDDVEHDEGGGVMQLWFLQVVHSMS